MCKIHLLRSEKETVVIDTVIIHPKEQLMLKYFREKSGNCSENL